MISKVLLYCLFFFVFNELAIFNFDSCSATAKCRDFLRACNAIIVCRVIFYTFGIFMFRRVLHDSQEKPGT